MLMNWLTPRMPISVIVLTFNEQANIAECLRTLVEWAGEVLVVDSGSADDTLKIAANYTRLIYQHEFENYSRQRNWSQEHLPLSHEWVFHIDADERVTPGLVNKLRSAFANESLLSQTSGFLVRRRIEFLGRHIKHGGIYPTYHCRIFRKGAGRCEERDYDQHFLVDGHLERLEADLTEVTASCLASWTTRHNRWAQMEARYLYSSGHHEASNQVRARLSGTPMERRRWLKASVYEKAPPFLRALVYFFVRYVLRGGFLDGTPGLIYHVLHGFWFRFYTDACYYELQQGKGTA